MMGSFSGAFRRRFPYSLVCLFALVLLPAAATPTWAAFGDCGQPATNGPNPVATDALFVLKAGVGSEQCDLCICDVDSNGAINATDALQDLRVAVGQPVTLNCVACVPSCFDAQAPACGGTCPDGSTCAEDPEYPGECECLNECEAGPAPTCGGNCDAIEPGTACWSYSIQPAGEPVIELCACIPPTLTFCAQATGPQCEGFCGAGAVCESDGGGGCMCTQQPAQPACEQAQAPGCLGSCGANSICEFDGVDACICAPYTGQSETCFDAQAPTCGGVCAFGEVCATELGDCDCFDPCEVSSAPTCGGECSFQNEVCTVTTFRLDGDTLDLCQCRPGPEPPACAEASAPACGGSCPQGQSCGEDPQSAGTCICTTPPVACGQAQAPQCDGTCSPGETCVDGGGGGCFCQPGQSSSCFESQAPTCGGTCGPGETCMEDPEYPGDCECFNECEAGPAPTCGGNCDAIEPGTTCRTYSVQSTGESAIDLCACIPPDLTLCAQATGPGCEGYCGPGAECESDGGSGCVCAALPVQPACGQAQAPTCAGSCGQNSICEFDGIDACSCVTYTGQNESCFTETAPTCGGVCGFGEVCATELGECDCYDPCEVSGAPTCGGECTFGGETCKLTVLTIDGNTIDLCRCRP